jgi:hypothetical protein
LRNRSPLMRMMHEHSFVVATPRLDGRSSAQIIR